MASVISAGTTSGTALNFSGDTSGVLQLASNGTTTALSISTAQVVTLTNALAVTSGGTGVTTSTGTGANVLGTSPTITTPTVSGDATISGLTIGKGGGAVSTNTAVGASALSANQAGGTNNTAIGNAALDANTTGDANTAVGDDALGANTTASYNTAVGVQAGYTNTTSGYNVFVGYRAGYTSNATAVANAGNVCVGGNAGSSLTTGAGNIFIGSDGSNAAGGAGSGVTTGSNNVIIGGNTGSAAPISATGSNYIVLADGAGNPRFYGDSSGYFLFGTARTSPRGLVDIPTSGGSGGAPLAVSRGGDGGPMVNFYSMNSTTTIIGSIANASNTSTTYNTSSDYRLKKNIAPMTGALAKVAQLKPVTYKWKLNGSDGQGFIAHELAEVVPDCVTGEKDAVDENGDMKPQGIDTSFLVATLTAAIQELKAINDTQAETINAQATMLAGQSATLVALTARVTALEGA